MSTTQANALQEKTESDAKQEAKTDDDEEYDPEKEHFDDDDTQDMSEAYKALASQLSVSTSNISIGQEQVSLLPAATTEKRTLRDKGKGLEGNPL